MCISTTCIYNLNSAAAPAAAAPPAPPAPPPKLDNEFAALARAALDIPGSRRAAVASIPPRSARTFKAKKKCKGKTSQ